MSSTMSTNAPAPAGSPVTNPLGMDPFGALRSIRTMFRPDLQITRTTTQGAPTYVVFDPVSFRSHRLTLNDYDVATRIQPHRTLQEVFEDCVQAGILEKTEELQFFSFAKQLSDLGLLNGQSAAPKALYERFSKAQRAAKRSSWLGFLFLTLPLANPDKFLDRTLPRVRCLFTWPVVVAWAIGLMAALTVIASRWTLFWEPLNGILALKNLVFMTLAFLALKVWHELGHGYACKLFGGRVPEMGCKLIVGMPLAYVDASAAWSFPRRRDRIIVMLGGMYFELLLTVPAALIWAYWPHTVIGSFAYQIVFMAGLATILFNINPLMKYDGYFILSDLLGIPNLQARSLHEVKSQLKARLLGIKKVTNVAAAARDRLIFLTYGISSSIYSWSLVLSIAAVIATRIPVVGLAIAACQVFWQVYQPLSKLYRYLWYADELASCRTRAKFLGTALAVGGLGLLALCPVLTSQHVSGVVSAARSTQLRVRTPGFVEAILLPVPETVKAGQELVRLRNIDVEINYLTSSLSAQAARQSMHVANQMTPADEASQLQVALTEAANLDVAEKNKDELILTAPHDGRLASILPSQRVGTLLQTGEVIATVVQGCTQVRAWLNEEQLATARLERGRTVSVRLANNATDTYSGTIHSVAPANKVKFEDLSLTSLNEGTIPIDPATSETREKVFQLLIDVPDLPCHAAPQAVRAVVRLDRQYESLGHWAFRQTTKFLNSFWAGTN